MENSDYLFIYLFILIADVCNVLGVLPRGTTPNDRTRKCTFNRRGSARLRYVYKEKTESESVEAEDPNDEEVAQRQPALNISTGLH